MNLRCYQIKRAIFYYIIIEGIMEFDKTNALACCLRSMKFIEGISLRQKNNTDLLLGRHS